VTPCCWRSLINPYASENAGISGVVTTTTSRAARHSQVTGRPTPEADAWTWQLLDDLASWCGKNMTWVLQSLDRGAIASLPALQRIEVDSSPVTPP